MNWLNRFDPRLWLGKLLKRSLTMDQFRALGLTQDESTSAGIPVTQENALGVSAVFCADQVISQDIGSFPRMVYDGHDDDAKPLPNDPVARLMRRPNSEMTGPVFWSAFQHNANLWGFGLAEIARDGAGNPAELWPIPSPFVRIERIGGRLAFYVPDANGGTTRMDPHDLLFLPGLTPDGTVGFRLLHHARTTIGCALASQRFMAARFKNGFNPSGAIESLGVLSDQARKNMRESWMALYSGVSGVGVPMLFEEGAKWTPFDIAHNQQLQLAELSDFLISEVSRFFNISPVKLHQLGRATWGNLEALNKDHVIGCLGPWTGKIDAEVEAKLLREGQSCKHVTDRLLQADMATRFAAWNSAVTAGWMTQNEARLKEDLPPLPGGDQLRSPLNQAPSAAPQAGTPPPEKPTDGNPPDPAQPAE